MHVYTYICIVKLEEALKSNRFRDNRHKAALNLMYTAYWLKDQISGTLKEEGFTAEQFNVMRILKGMHPEMMCVRDIASRMIEKSSNVPRIIDRLVVKKFVKRTPSKEDKRETLISLTDMGMQQLAIASKAVEEISEAVIGINEKEAEQLHELLEKLRQDK